MKKINVGTVFSGIGAFEQALKKLGIKHNIKFAGDIDNFMTYSPRINAGVSSINKSSLLL